MEFINNAIIKVKEAVDVACKKTGEVVTAEKQKFDISTLKAKRDKDFTALGKIYYEKVKFQTVNDIEVLNLVDSINQKNDEINRLLKEFNESKNKGVCPKCYSSVDVNSAFCSSCGAKLNIEED
jgi:hypothetical protein